MPEEDDAFEMMKHILSQQEGRDLTDDEVRDIMEEDELQCTSIRIEGENADRLLRMIESGDELDAEALQDTILNMLNNSEQEVIDNDGNITTIKLVEPNYSNEDTSDVEPMSVDELQRLMEQTDD